jgi:hypothetical protein
LTHSASPNAERQTIERSGAALLIALTVGGLSIVSPPLSVLLLVALGARALMRAEAAPRFDFVSVAAPLLASAVVGVFVGLAGAIGVLFVWRLYADTRWSVAEAERLTLAAGKPQTKNLLLGAHAWLTPLYGLTLVAFTAPHMVAGLPLDLPHVPQFVPVTVAILAAAALFDWALRRAVDWRLGELASAPAMQLMTHHVMLLCAFGFGFDVSAGIVAMLAWRFVHAAPLPRLQPSLTAVP